MTIQKATGCLHPNRNANEICKVCGKGICNECYIAERIVPEIGTGSERAYSTGWKSDYTEEEFKMIKFCPKCYLDLIRDPEFRIIIPDMKSDGKFVALSPAMEHKKQPGKVLFVICCLGPPSLFIWPIYFLIKGKPKFKKTYEEFHKREAKAKRIVKQMEATPVKETTQTVHEHEVIYCGECGEQNEANNSFCNKCGEKLE